MDPLNCEDLIERGLASEAHCCDICHEEGPVAAVIVPTPTEEIRAVVCCSQALTLNAHEYVKDWTKTA
jgi:hypothetical protein